MAPRNVFKLLKTSNTSRARPSEKPLKLKLRNDRNGKENPVKNVKLNKYDQPMLTQLENRLGSSETKRPVIIDGCNVGYAHAIHQQFSIEGMQTCIQHFENLGHPTIAVVPTRRRQNNSNPRLLQQLNDEKKVVFSPFDNEYGRCTDTYDDKCILGLAVNYGGCVVSNDNYRDIINQNKDWREVIKNRVIPYCFFKDMFIIPRDPYGPGRPSLEKILNKS